MTLKEAVEYLEQRISWASLKGDYDIFIQGRRADDLLALLKSLEDKEKCLKTKCVICPHCDNCDVDENGKRR